MFRGKLNAVRTLSLLSMIAGFTFMYAAIAAKRWPWAMTALMILGFVLVLASGGAYFVIGALSMRAVRVVCPTCDKETKMLGTDDRCMHCGQRLTLDPAHAAEPVSPVSADIGHEATEAGTTDRMQEGEGERKEDPKR
ncbi:MAG: hypothetical protein IMW86_02985 [Hydrogenibacillus sp.]|nr:hypothetical protein [Hydrogenibacillus sp.]